MLCKQVRPTASQRRKLKQLHWDKIKAPQEGTIWHQASALNPNLNFAELESLFQVSFCCQAKPSSTHPSADWNLSYTSIADCACMYMSVVALCCTRV